MPNKVYTNKRITVRLDINTDWENAVLYIVVTYHVPEIHEYKRVRFEANQLREALALMKELEERWAENDSDE